MMGAVNLDADRIAPRLWQGADPPQGPWLHELGVNVLVLCAAESQPSAHRFPGIKVIYAPMHDSAHVPADVAGPAAERVARYVRRGKRVLVCCAMGWNRSGLVTALALWILTGVSGAECVKQVQSRRENALGNEQFRQYVEALPPRQRHRVYRTTTSMSSGS